MCSFLFSTKKDDLKGVNFFLKPRGPDGTTVEYVNNHLFLHNLLHVTGEKTIQPLHKDGIHLLYNGEIYNYKSFGDYDSDSKCLIPLYQQFGYDFVRQLDGEFAICLIDYEKQIAIISTDIFKTKPMFFSIHDGHFGCSTYQTPLSKLGLLNIQRVEPNTTYVICLKTFKVIHKQSVYDFDITQHKTNFDDWIEAFEQSIFKRTNDVKVRLSMGLSSGYDSGIIFSELIKQNVPSVIVSFVGKENKQVLKERINKATTDMECIELFTNDSTNTIYKLLIKTYTEPFEYNIHDNSEKLLTDDRSAIYFAQVCKQVKSKGCKILLSGTGGDEILSDYELKHLFPQDLKTVFPWPNFFGSKMESYLAHDEYIGGVFGLEVRYPLLDKRLVQEFLWLDHTLKNKSYKAPIRHYFDLNSVSYREEKIGFSI